MIKNYLLFLGILGVFFANSYAMHPSWDLDNDLINDCEAEGNCDDSIDYSLPKTYVDKESFLKAEGLLCEVASDGCNTVMLSGGEAGAMTMMYCEDIYGENGSEKRSCQKYINSTIENTQNKHSEYIDENLYDSLYNEFFDKVFAYVSILNDDRQIKLIDQIEKLIENTKMTKIAKEFQIQRITTFVAIKDIIWSIK